MTTEIETLFVGPAHSGVAYESPQTYASVSEAVEWLVANAFTSLSGEPGPSAYLNGPKGITVHRGTTPPDTWASILDAIHHAGGTVANKPQERAASYLTPLDLHRLNWACRPVVEAFGEPVYLVGSVLTRPDFRDVDLRLILSDGAVERMFCAESFGVHKGGDPGAVRLLLNIALSDLISRAAGLPWPIDFQIQSQTEANAERGMRNPMGIRRTPVQPKVTA